MDIVMTSQMQIRTNLNLNKCILIYGRFQCGGRRVQDFLELQPFFLEDCSANSVTINISTFQDNLKYEVHFKTYQHMLLPIYSSE